MDFQNYSKKHLIVAVAGFIFSSIFLAIGIWFHIPPKNASASSVYSYYRSITVTSTISIASGTQTNFPMLVSSTISTWESISHGGHVQNLVTAPNGGQEPADLIFSTSTACSSSLNFETESYSSSTGALVDWVNVPSLFAGSVIYVCYGNNGVTSDQSHPSSTWNSNYTSVWHMNESSAGLTVPGTIHDSTANGVSLITQRGANSLEPSSQPGVFGAGIEYPSNSQYSGTGATSSLVSGVGTSTNLSVEAWVNIPVNQSMDGSVSFISLLSSPLSGCWTNFGLWANSSISGIAASAGNNCQLGVTAGFVSIQTSTWYHFVGTYDGTNLNLYENGTLAASAVGSVTFPSDVPVQLSTGIRSVEAIDAEVRISDKTLSPSWILTEYNNQSSPGTFYTIGCEVGGSESGAVGTSTWISVSNQNWSVASNWSGGCSPGPATNVLFSASSTVNTTIDTSTAVQAFTIASGYTGTITQSANQNLTISTSGFSQAAGTFIGGSGAGSTTVDGPFLLSGGTFKSPTTNLALYGAVAFSGGTFNNNSGTIILSQFSTPQTVSGSATFYNLQLGDGTSGGNILLNVATGTTLTIQSSTVLEQKCQQVFLLGGGTIAAQGDVDDIATIPCGGGLAVPTSTFNFMLTGSANQTIADFNESNATYPFYLPDLTINKANGVAAVASTYMVVQSTTIMAGELRLASGSLVTASRTFVNNGTFTINSGGVLSDYGQTSSTLLLGGNAVNNGFVFFDGIGPFCYGTSSVNYIAINSVGSSQPSWSGSGGFLLRYVAVTNQTGTALISDLNGTSLNATSGAVNGLNWSFPTGPVPELVQKTGFTSQTGFGTMNLTFPYKPRGSDLIIVAIEGQNETIVPPTDNASNTYILVASSTFSSSPTYSLSLYYAKNVTPSSSLVIAIPTNSSLSTAADAFEYTGMDPSSTFDTYSADTPTSPASLITSLTANGGSANELFFGTLVVSAAITPSSGSGWTPEIGSGQFAVEDMASTPQINAAATWSSTTSTRYAAILGVFHAPYIPGYASGTLDSATFDTGAGEQAQLNSLVWQGATPNNSSVEFQIAVSNSSSSGWLFEGPDGTANTYFTGGPGIPISLVGTTNGYTLFNGYRYFRYRATLFPDPTGVYTPTVTQVTVNWSP